MTTLSRLAPVAIASTLMLALVGCPFPNQTNQTSQPNTLQLSASKAIPVGEGPHGIALAGGVLVNANPKSGNLSFIDPDTETELKRLDFPGGAEANSPTQTKATPDGQYAIVPDTKANLLRVIKGASQEQVSTVELGEKPGSRLAWADGSTAYLAVGTGADSNVVKVSWPNGFEAAAATSSLTVSRPAASAFTAGFVAHGGGFLAVPNGPDNAVSFVALIDPASVTTLQEGNNPGPVDISTYGGEATLVVGNKNSNTVLLYDLKAKQTLATLQVGSFPTDIAMRSDGRYAYVTCKGSGEVAVIEVANRKLHGLVKVGRGLPDKAPNPVHLYAVEKPSAASSYHVSHEDHAQQIWVGGDGDASVTVIDAETQTVVAVVTVGVGHHKMAFTATKAFVSNITDNTVSVIDRSVIR